MGGRAAEVYLYRKKNAKTEYDSYIFDNFKDLDITTGAVGDLKQANELARKYITEYEFGDNLCYNKDNSENELPFLEVRLAIMEIKSVMLKNTILIHKQNI